MAWIRLDLPEAEILFSDRTGGVSAPPFDTANAGYSRGDDPLTSTRTVLASARGWEPGLRIRGEWISLHQVHGATVYPRRPAVPWANRDPGDDGGAGATGRRVGERRTGGGAVGAHRRLRAGGSRRPGVVAAVHAGWRGWRPASSRRPWPRCGSARRGRSGAVLGPCVHPECYEFSAADLDPIAERLGPGCGREDLGGPTGPRRPPGHPAGAGPASG